jgi:hypothetical protein
VLRKTVHKQTIQRKDNKQRRIRYAPAGSSGPVLVRSRDRGVVGGATVLSVLYHMGSLCVMIFPQRIQVNVLVVFTSIKVSLPSSTCHAFLLSQSQVGHQETVFFFCLLMRSFGVWQGPRISSPPNRKLHYVCWRGYSFC